MTRALTIDEVCNRPPGSFKKFLKEKERFLKYLDAERKCRIHYRKKPIRGFFAGLLVKFNYGRLFKRLLCACIFLKVCKNGRSMNVDLDSFYSFVEDQHGADVRDLCRKKIEAQTNPGDPFGVLDTVLRELPPYHQSSMHPDAKIGCVRFVT